MTLLESLNWRYATKKFDSSKIISANYVDKQSGFNLSASSYGLQPVTLLVHNKSIQRFSSIINESDASRTSISFQYFVLRPY